MARQVVQRFACLLCAGLPHCAPYNIHTDLTLLLFKTESCLAEFLMREEVFFSTDPWSSHSTFILYFQRQGLLAQTDLSLRAVLKETLLLPLSMEYSYALCIWLIPCWWGKPELPSCSAGTLSLSHTSSRELQFLTMLQLIAYV